MKKDVFKNTISCNLKSIDFKEIPYENPNSLTVKDSFSIVEQDEESLILNYNRIVRFNVEKNTCYSLSVHFEVMRPFLSEETSKCVDYNYVNTNIEKILANLPSKMSLLISQITNEVNFIPLITEPSFIREK